MLGAIAFVAFVLGLALIVRVEIRRLDSLCPKCGSSNVYHPIEGGLVCFNCSKD